MSFIPYNEFKDLVKAIVFPEGEAENLFTTHDSYIQDALIDLQTFVPCLRDNNVDFYDKTDFQEWCNTDFTYIPRGVVHAVYAFLPGKQCKKLFYDPKSVAWVDSWMQKQRCVTCPDQDDPDSPARGPLCETMSIADSYCDSVDDAENDTIFKGSRRYYSIASGDKLILAPRFPCGYKIAVHWEGLKRKYDGTEPVPEDTELVIAVAKYVQAQIALFLDRDTQIYDRIMHPKLGEYTLARANMIHRCTKERRIQERHQALDGFDVLQPFFYDPLPEPEDVFAYISDWGNLATAGSNAPAVSDLIEGFAPEVMVTGGDNKYGDTLTNIFATMTYYSSLRDTALFYPAIGNHDLSDGGGLTDFTDNFPYLTQLWNYTRNYSIRRRYVEFFFMETHDTGTPPPTLSAQLSWLTAALANSPAQWKVVITQDPPYTSGTGNYPGHADSQIDYAGLGADVVLSGDSHSYERLSYNGLPILVNGAGGTPLVGFNATPSPYSILRYNDYHGAIIGKSSRSQLKLDFYNINGLLIDSITLRKYNNGMYPCTTIINNITGNSGANTNHYGAALDPNGVVTGRPGDWYKSLISLGGDGSAWFKASGNGNTGWE